MRPRTRGARSTGSHRRSGPGDLLAGVERPARRWRRLGRRRLRRGLVAVVVAGAVATTAVAEQRRRAWEPTTTVVVAARDLPAGAPLDGGAAAARRVPADLAPASALDPTPVGGALPTLSRPVGAGEVLVADDVAPPGRTGLVASLEDGERAVAVPVATAPTLQVGQHVDLLGGEAVVATGARVLAVDEAGGELTVALRASAAEAVARSLPTGPLVAALRGP